MVRIGYFQGSAGNLVATYHFLLAPASGTLLVLLDTHLGSSPCILPVGLCIPIPAQHDGSLPHFQPRAKHECRPCPSATLAKFPCSLSNSRLFPAGLTELQVQFSLQGSALFSVTPGAGVQ